MTLLAPAPHLWQVGLAPADGRIVHTAVCPVDVDLTWVLHSLRRTIPGPIA